MNRCLPRSASDKPLAMQTANVPANEIARLQSLRDFDIMDTEPDEHFDDLTRMAARVCETPISLISMLDANRQWFKSKFGLLAPESERETAFCSYTILGDDILEVPDASRDSRFFNNPLVTGPPKVVFYAGVPLRTTQGLNIGSLCVIDHKPRMLHPDQVEVLKTLARQAIHLLNLHQKVKKVERVGEAALNAQAASHRISRILREERSRMLGYLEKAPVALSVLTGSEFTFEVVNQEYRKIVGPEKQLIGKKYFEIFPHGQGTDIERMFHRVYCDGETISETDYRVDKIDPHGVVQSHYYDFQMQPFASPTGKKGILTIGLDTTKKNQALHESLAAKEAADEANLAKSTFLANMSHEIRTPLGAIMGFAEELSQPDVTPEQFQQYLAVINRNSSHLQRIIDDILDLSKVEAGKMVIESIECSIKEMIAEFIALMNHRAIENKVKFACTIQPGIPDLIMSDPVRIKQILTNIVGNAIKFAPNGRVELIVTTSQKFLEFRVKDTGVGISPEQATKLFQPFMQADASTTRKFGGTGLGLVLTKKLCESMGGTFHLESSKPLMGSTFVAKIRILGHQESLMPPPRPTASYNVESNPVRPLENFKILLVEDSQDNQLLIRILLEKAGALVTTANDGFEGVLKALSGDYDLVLMDVQMPELDGLDATRELRRKGFVKPIVALTAHAMTEEKQRCLNAGFDDFLSKPIQKERMIAVLKSNIQEGRYYEGPFCIEV